MPREEDLLESEREAEERVVRAPDDGKVVARLRELSNDEYSRLANERRRSRRDEDD